MGYVHQEVEISDAAIRAYAGLLRALPGRISTHASRDGGLICEMRPRRARPILWRILADGTLRPDNRYSFVRKGFITTQLPQAK